MTCYRIQEAYPFQDEVLPEQSEDKDRNEASETSLERHALLLCSCSGLFEIIHLLRKLQHQQY